MPPNKSKRCREESPEQDRLSKRQRFLEESEDEEEEEDQLSLDGGTSNSKGNISKQAGPSFKSPGVNSHNKPAELFRKDLISAMKLPDSEPLASDDYYLIADQWKQEWEKGVQVPVNEEGIPEIDLREVQKFDKTIMGDFKLPLNKKYLHACKDDTYRQGVHELTGMQQLSEQVVRYDLDDLDVCWLKLVNQEREKNSEILIHEWTMEKIFESLEAKCHEMMENKKKTEEGLGIEYDEDVVCDVCRSPEGEDNNEMVFCDGCNMCVHQACYGIQKIPEGSWLCRTCALGIKPQCILCPKMGGAMKSTRSGTKWAHVCCAIWIPEVTIGCVEKMEPITKISQIPASRWSLICSLCKERAGACIQCSVKACKTAFHVTCAFQHNLEMKTLLSDVEADEGIRLRGYCLRHTRNKDYKATDRDSPQKSLPGTPRKELSDEEIQKLRAEKLKELQEEFYRDLNLQEIADELQLDVSVIELIYSYWILKRKTLFDAPLLTPKTEEEDLLERQQEDSLIARMRMFVQLRQDLERVRNLCYMVCKREKMKKSYYKIRESFFMGLLKYITDPKMRIGEKDAKRAIKLYHFNSIYDSDVQSKLKINPDTFFDGENSNFSQKPTEEELQRSFEDEKETTSHKEVDDEENCKRSTEEGVNSLKMKAMSTPSASEKRGENSRIRRNLQQKYDETTSEEEIDVVSEFTDSVSGQVDTDRQVSGENQGLVHGRRSRTNGYTNHKFGVSEESHVTPRKSLRQQDIKEEPPSSPEQFDVKEEHERKKASSTKKSRAKSKLSGLVSDSSDKNKDLRLRQKTMDICLDDNVSNVSKDSEGYSHRRSSSEQRNSPISAIKEEEMWNQPRGLRSSVKSEPDSDSRQDFPEFNSKLNGKVSARIKAEISRYMQASKLVISNKIINKVQRGLLRASNSRTRLSRIGGIQGQRKIDAFFSKLDHHNGNMVNDSRILNEISPSRSRHPGNTQSDREASPRGSGSSFRILRKSDNCVTSSNRLLFNGSPGPETRSSRRRTDNFDSSSLDALSRNSSRENSPDSTGSVPCRTMHLRGDGDRRSTRGSSPASLHSISDVLDVENVYHDSSRKRFTRSQLLGENESSRDSTDSVRHPAPSVRNVI